MKSDGQTNIEKYRVTANKMLQNVMLDQKKYLLRHHFVKNDFLAMIIELLPFLKCTQLLKEYSFKVYIDRTIETCLN